MILIMDRTTTKPNHLTLCQLGSLTALAGLDSTTAGRTNPSDSSPPAQHAAVAATSPTVAATASDSSSPAEHNAAATTAAAAATAAAATATAGSEPAGTHWRRCSKNSSRTRPARRRRLRLGSLTGPKPNVSEPTEDLVYKNPKTSKVEFTANK